MLAMEAQAPRGVRQPVSSLTTIASVLAPTGEHVRDGGWSKQQVYPVFNCSIAPCQFQPGAIQLVFITAGGVQSPSRASACGQ